MGMCSGKIRIRLAAVAGCWLGTILFLLGFFAGTCQAEAGPNIVFLPLKINAETDAAELQRLADQALNDALKAKGHSLTPRADAEKMFNYGATWPPSFTALGPLMEQSSAAFVATGSLTRLGTQVSVDIALFDAASEGAVTYYFKEGDPATELSSIVRGVVGDALAHAGRYYQIAALKVQGNARIDTGAILRNVTSKAGDRYDPKTVREDLKLVFKMGYFDDVRVQTNETEKGKEIVFEVKEKPVISRILYEGIKELKEEDVKEVVKMAPNTILNTKELQDSVQKVQLLYKEKGYYNTKVEPNLTYPSTERVDVHFVIEEGDKVFIKEIKIAGNSAVETKKIKKVVETSEKGFFSWLTDSGVLKREILEQDAARITAYYHNQGYIDAKVGEPEVVQDGKWLYVTFNIFEGDRYRVGTIAVTGDLIDSEEALRSKVKLSAEEYFSRKVLREDVLRLNDLYADQGYAHVEVDPSVSKRQDDKVVDVSFNVKQGTLVHLNRIVVKGNTRTRENVIRRELAIKETGVFSASDMRKSHQNLQRLEYFEEANITPEQGLDEGTMDVNVEVKEKPTGAFSIGGGYSSMENLMFMAEIKQNNFLGKGQQLGLQASLGSRTTRYNLSFTDPRWNDSRLLVGTDLYDWRLVFDDYTKDSLGGGLRFGYPIWEKVRMSWGYSYDNTTLSDVREDASQAIKDSEDIHVTSAVSLGFRRDTRDRLYDPSTGSDCSINVKYAGDPLGGDSAFTKVTTSVGWYVPFFWDTTYHAHASLGRVFENSEGKLPVYEKFYLGGMNSIRGFNGLSISPRDPETGEKIGGEEMWFINLEWIFPLVKEAGLKGVVFADVGNVYTEEQDWDFQYAKRSVGLGFRWLSPMGPLRLEWGYNLEPVDNEDQSNWDFTIGGFF